MIGIFYRAPRDFYIFEKLAETLGAEFLLAPSIATPTLQRSQNKIMLKQYEAAKKFILSKKIKHRVLPFDIINFQADKFAEYFYDFDLLIDKEKTFFMIHPVLADKKKILYLYEDAITGYWPLTGFSQIDTVLATGLYFEKIVSPFIPTATVGNLYLDLPEALTENKLPKKILPSKKTLLFSPREEFFRFPQSFSGVLNELSGNYNIIVHLTAETIAARKNINLFSLNKKVLVLDESFDVRLLRGVIDLVISDRALTVFEWTAIGIPAIFLDCWTDKFALRYVGEHAKLSLKPKENLYSAHSPEELKTMIPSALNAIPEKTSFVDDLFSGGPAFRRAGEVVEKIRKAEKVTHNAFASLVFEPGETTMRSYIFYQQMKPLFNSVADIIREPSFIKRLVKTLKTFF